VRAWIWAGLALVAFGIGCGPRSEWVVDQQQTAQMRKNPGQETVSRITVWKGADGGTASAEALGGSVPLMSRSFRVVVRDRLERFRRYRGGPAVQESAHLLYAMGPRKQGALVAVYLFGPSQTQWALLELPTSRNWQARLADLVHNRLDLAVPEAEIPGAKEIRPTPESLVFRSKMLGTVPLPEAWFDMVGEGLASPPDPGEGLMRTLVLSGSKGFVDVQAVRTEEHCASQMGYKGWRSFDASKMKEGVNIVPGRASGKRAFVVRELDRFVLLVETDGPVRNKVTSTEALAKFFDTELHTYRFRRQASQKR
jgi:hypothetical protein